MEAEPIHFTTMNDQAYTLTPLSDTEAELVGFTPAMAQQLAPGESSPTLRMIYDPTHLVGRDLRDLYEQAERIVLRESGAEILRVIPAPEELFDE